MLTQPMATVIAALIGAAATIVIALIANHEALRLFLVNPWSGYKGQYECQWWVTAGTDGQSRILDSVTISKVAGERIMGTGCTVGAGSWAIRGRARSNAIAADYTFVDSGRQGEIGVVLLKMVGPKLYSGHWVQFKSDGTFDYGTTEWKKV